MSNYKELLARVSFDPAVCHGKAHIRKTRVLVSALLDSLADGESEKQILREYPSLQEADIKAALAYAATLAREELLVA